MELRIWGAKIPRNKEEKPITAPDAARKKISI
jgi:hypothetical protein